MTTAEQITAMESLSQGAAARLLGMNGRSMRDSPTIPRNSDGTYDGTKLVEWARSRHKPSKLDDEQLERILVAAEEMAASGAVSAAQAFCGLLDDLADNYGDSALAAFTRALRDSCAIYAECSDDPLETKLDRVRDQHARDLAVAELRIVSQCDTCNRIRKGSKWDTRRCANGPMRSCWPRARNVNSGRLWPLADL